MHAFELETVDIPGLSPEHKLVIRLYTIEQPVAIYHVLNACYKAKDRSPALAVNQAAFSRLLIEALRALMAVPGKRTFTMACVMSGWCI